MSVSSIFLNQQCPFDLQATRSSLKKPFVDNLIKKSNRPCKKMSMDFAGKIVRAIKMIYLDYLRRDLT